MLRCHARPFAHWFGRAPYHSSDSQQNKRTRSALGSNCVAQKGTLCKKNESRDRCNVWCAAVTTHRVLNVHNPLLWPLWQVREVPHTQTRLMDALPRMWHLGRQRLPAREMLTLTFELLPTMRATIRAGSGGDRGDHCVLAKSGTI